MTPASEHSIFGVQNSVIEAEPSSSSDKITTKKTKAKGQDFEGCQ